MWSRIHPHFKSTRAQLRFLQHPAHLFGPGGTLENSPALQSAMGKNQVPPGTADPACRCLGRPCGTGGWQRRVPSTQVLGYSQSSLRDGPNRAASLQKTEMRPTAGSTHPKALPAPSAGTMTTHRSRLERVRKPSGLLSPLQNRLRPVRGVEAVAIPGIWHRYRIAPASGRTVSSSSAVSGSICDSRTVTTSTVSPTALNTSKV